MRKKFISIFIVCIMTFTAASVSGCSYKGGDSVVFSSDMFKGYRIKLDNAAQLGIANKTSTSGNVSMNSSQKEEKTRKKNRLITVDEDGEQSDVVFEKENK